MRLLGPHTRTYVAHTLTQKLFSNMKRISKGYSGVDILLFPTMLTAPESSLSRITSSPSLSPQTHPSTSQQPPTPPFMQTIHDEEEPATLPHESPLHSVHSLGRDKGSLSLNELTDLCTSLSKKVEDEGMTWFQNADAKIKEKNSADTEIILEEELKAYLDLVPREEFAMEIESLATKYPIVDWKTYILAENFMYYQIFRADGSSKNYKIFSEMLDDFDKQDVLDLHRLVKARYMTSSLEGYDLMLWGDLKTLFEPDEEDEVWRNQQGYNLISWRL
ncbi:hypothetical protein Tco_0484482 [Tanacetum coccineum]